MYRITTDRANQLLEVHFIDSYDDIDQTELNRELRAAALKVRGAGDHFDLLVDFTRTTVMPQTLTPGVRTGMEWCAANGMRRSASVMNSTITKMQVKRLSADDRVQTFTSRAEALAWLGTPD